MITEKHVADFKNWLGEENIRYFRHIKELTGSVFPVLKLNYKRKGMPTHPTFWREGMQIRNWMRRQDGLDDSIDASLDLDTLCYELMERAIL